MRLKIIAFSSFALLTSACANPHVVPPVSESDRAKECAAIQADISQTELYRKEARAEDKFQWKYVFMVNAATSWVRMNKAEEAAEKRLAELNQLYASKCGGGADLGAAPALAPLPVTPSIPLEPQAESDALPVGEPIE